MTILADPVARAAVRLWKSTARDWHATAQHRQAELNAARAWALRWKNCAKRRKRADIINKQGYIQLFAKQSRELEAARARIIELERQLKERP